MIAEELMGIRKFIMGMRDPDHDNELRINAENTDYIVFILRDMSARIEQLENAVVPPHLRQQDVTTEGNVVSLSQFKTTHQKRKHL